MEVRYPVRASPIFRSDVARLPRNLGLVGEAPPPEGMYAHSTRPAKFCGQVQTATFCSLGYRFGADGHLTDLRVRQRPLRSRDADRPDPATVHAPDWLYAALSIPPDHAARLAAARASHL